ncbi:unnamed protein product [Ilex paraguariensis]|uniref:Uncharacterized protein n=1 Tax=Ilex paraguariensis TaxID=185542 RepID=A0ABC8QWG4_9AQUA
MESHGAGLRRVLVLAFCVAGIWWVYIYQCVGVQCKCFPFEALLTDIFKVGAVLSLTDDVLLWNGLQLELEIIRAQYMDCVELHLYNNVECVEFLLVLAKSSKMIPVMLMGTLVYGVRYTLPEYVCTLLVAGGVSVFALSKTSSKTISKLAHPNAALGYGLCFLNLAFDGFTNCTQDSITARHNGLISAEI